MIIILEKTAKKNRRTDKRLTDKGVIVSPVVGETMTILGLVGDTSKTSMDTIQQHHIVERIKFKSLTKKLQTVNSIRTIQSSKLTDSVSVMDTSE